MAQIERTGVVSFGDAALFIQEEGIVQARNSGGHKAASEWERQFKRDVFLRIIQAMNRIGWTCCMPDIDQHAVECYSAKVARWSAESKRMCSKGDLKADLSISGRCIELKFFQSVNTPTRPDHEGRYEHNKERCMPYLLWLEMNRTRNKIRNYLCAVFTEYSFKENTPPIYYLRDKTTHTAQDCIAGHYASTWHFKGVDWEKYRDTSGMSHNVIGADKTRIEHGQRVWFFDLKGRINTGIAQYNINNMWWVVTGRHDYRNMAYHELYSTIPENFRHKRNAWLRRKTLEAILNDAIKAMNFERAAVLRDIVYPKDQPLFLVYHTEHNLYHRPGFSGYANNIIDAGKFTRDELRGYEREPNRVVPYGEAKVLAEGCAA